MVNIAILGFGTVGGGVAKVLKEHKAELSNRVNDEIRLKYILDIKDFNGFENIGIEKCFTKDINTILEDEDIKIVIETIGGLSPAFDYVKKCILKGKHVVTANTKLVAEKGDYLLQLAKDNNVHFMFEASVGGGIPIIKPLSQFLVANNALAIGGVLNDYVNYILTEMTENEIDMKAAIKKAKTNFYFYGIFKFDLTGENTLNKICILASLTYGKHIHPYMVHKKGIEDITPADIKYAKKINGVIKLIGMAYLMENGKIQITAEPMIIPNENYLSKMDGAFNTILIKGDSTGDIIFSGKGFGALPSASSVIADVIDCIKNFDSTKYLLWDEALKYQIMAYKDAIMSLMIRVKYKDEQDAKDVIKQNFKGGYFIKLEGDEFKNEFAFITEKSAFKNIKGCINRIINDDTQIISVLQISNL